MPNTVFGPYIQTTWVQNVTAANATNMNHLETGPIYALHGYNSDLLTPYVDHGIVASRDGTVLNQLNVTAGRAYVTVLDSSGISSLALIATVSSTASQFLTSTPSTTYSLFLLNDGTWQWGTTPTGPTHSLKICNASTDGSGNISVVTDERTLFVIPFPNAEQVTVPYVTARATNIAVTTTTDNFLMAYVDVAGYYRVNMTFAYRNPTPQKVIASVAWADPAFSPTLTTGYFFESLSGMFLNGSQATATSNNSAVACAPLTLYSDGTSGINVHFRDPGGTPNDVVTTFIERVA